jgi:hypothetical protein
MIRQVSGVISLLALIGWSSLGAQQRAAAPSRIPDVAVYALTLSGPADASGRALADSCVARLVRQLEAESLSVVRPPPLDLKDLRRARPARFAMVGKLEFASGKYSLEWSLLEIETGDELRSYFAGPGAAEVITLADAAAPRIAAAIREQVAGPSRRP